MKTVEVTMQFLAEVPDDLDVRDVDVAIDMMCLVKKPNGPRAQPIPGVRLIHERLHELEEVDLEDVIWKYVNVKEKVNR